MGLPWGGLGLDRLPSAREPLCASIPAWAWIQPHSVHVGSCGMSDAWDPCAGRSVPEGKAPGGLMPGGAAAAAKPFPGKHAGSETCGVAANMQAPTLAPGATRRKERPCAAGHSVGSGSPEWAFCPPRKCSLPQPRSNCGGVTAVISARLVDSPPPPRAFSTMEGGGGCPEWLCLGARAPTDIPPPPGAPAMFGFLLNVFSLDTQDAAAGLDPCSQGKLPFHPAPTPSPPFTQALPLSPGGPRPDLPPAERHSTGFGCTPATHTGVWPREECKASEALFSPLWDAALPTAGGLGVPLRRVPQPPGPPPLGERLPQCSRGPHAWPPCRSCSSPVPYPSPSPHPALPCLGLVH